ncbi:MAG: biotin transporter BioY [bacterium]|nr:biotin transporter BioY [bacterium]
MRINSLTMADRFAPSSERALTWWVYQIVVVACASALIAFSAQISVRLPFSPVPVTGQTFGVLLTAAALGRVRAVAAVSAYLLEGFGGLPVFAGASAGFIHLFGPTGGYLFGFLPAAWLMGWLTERGWNHHWQTAALSMLIGSAVILAAGAMVLGLFVGYARAIQLGILPFLAGDVLKIAVATMMLPVAHRILGNGN